MFNKQLLCCAMAAVALTANIADAAVSTSEAAKLGTTLTPIGAEKAGNAGGSIPEWTGGITQAPADYKPGQHHIDPFVDDQPLFTITNENLSQYRDKLSAGQIALFEHYPTTFRMPVYQSRRTGAAPQWVYDNIKKNATTAELVEGGSGFSKAYGGVPFPIPNNGLEAIWNHMARFRGQYMLWERVGAAVIQQSGAISLSTSRQEVKFKYYDPNGSYETLNNLLSLYTSTSLEPARYAGNSALVHETLDQLKEPRKSWAYNPGQRRVRRAPTIGYDTPTSTSESMQTTDSVDMFNGSPDRYEWKLVGKRELYIPYNSYKISAKGVKYKNLLTPNHLEPELARYELHRVWVVEATLKPAFRHIYSKRTFFLDEDSWQIAVADQYDSRGEIWIASMAYLKNYYELPAIWASLEVHHDLQGGRYFVTGLDMEEKATVKLTLPAPEDNYFEPSSLRRRGVR